MKNAHTTQRPRPEALDAIDRLSREGVHVASGSGSEWQRAVVSFVVALGLWLAVSQSLADPLFLWMLLPVLLVIDFLSGFVHWFFDTQVVPSRSFFGRIAVDFLDHHIRPGRTAEVGFFTSAWRPALLVSAPLMAFSMLAPLAAWLAAALFWIGFLSMLVPQTHKEAHLGKRPAPIAALQTFRLIIHPASHQAHHDDNRESFCVFTGWLNPLLDRIRFWRAMEWVFKTARAAR
jgi:ubiquitin-conjugating enzyme E2 variant